MFHGQICNKISVISFAMSFIACSVLGLVNSIDISHNGSCCFLPANICGMSTTNYINLSQLFSVLFATVTRTAWSRQESDIQCFPISINVIFAPYFFDSDKLNNLKSVAHTHIGPLWIQISMYIPYGYIRLRLFLLGSIRMRLCKNLVYLLGHCL